MDIRYLAGLFDGEGSINVQWAKKNAKVLTLRMTVSSTDKTIIEEITDRYGGTFSSQGKPKKGHRQAYRWMLYGWNAVALLDRLYKYLRIKKKVCKEALRWQNLKRGHCRQKPISEYEYKRRVKLFTKVKELNRRGEDYK